KTLGTDLDAAAFGELQHRRGVDPGRRSFGGSIGGARGKREAEADESGESRGEERRKFDHGDRIWSGCGERSKRAAHKPFRFQRWRLLSGLNLASVAKLLPIAESASCSFAPGMAFGVMR